MTVLAFLCTTRRAHSTTDNIEMFGPLVFFVVFLILATWCASYIHKSSLSIGKKRAIYTPELGYKYIPYHQSDIGGDINKGLTRTGYTYTDIRNSENNVDIKITYKQGDKEHTRIVRVSR